ncbi:MAG: DnaD domain protein, partial [Clostridia bacterium]|nr:DnaD domain protein [Clostridia bacterium]
MKYNIEYGASVLNLPGKAIEKIGKASKAELEILLLLSSAGGEYDADDFALKAGITPSEVETAVNFWRGAGVITFDVSRVSETVEVHNVAGTNVSVLRSGDVSQYTGEELAEIFNKNPELKSLIDEVQRTLGKMLSYSESNKIVSLVENYRFSVEYVLLLTRHIVDIDRGTVPYIVSYAKKMYDNGIFTVDALEEYVKQEESLRSFEARVRYLFGIGTRKLTSKEKNFIDSWSKMMISDDILNIAYDVAVDNTGSPSFPYMNKVLMNWSEAGYKTVDDVNTALENYKKNKEKTASSSSFDEDEFFEAAM